MNRMSDQDVLRKAHDESRAFAETLHELRKLRELMARTRTTRDSSARQKGAGKPYVERFRQRPPERA